MCFWAQNAQRTSIVRVRVGFGTAALWQRRGRRIARRVLDNTFQRIQSVEMDVDLGKWNVG